MVSWFVKQALLNVAADTGLDVETPTSARVGASSCSAWA
jgi:homospermidine synthase